MSIACVYRGPSATHLEYQQTIQVLDNIARYSTRPVVMGEFNLRYREGQQPSLLDLIITAQDEEGQSL
ncbi:unnamed protein product [Echinostoma caproni]|uniref:Endo/exonuclease/phosphatase domain-containing protein n=1 Tax=Echinostoma caproni TaxID=27848 RepID=A0A183BAN8_9TREM|nr:unnamed protein product [Echinostoma caproni]